MKKNINMKLALENLETRLNLSTLAGADKLLTKNLLSKNILNANAGVETYVQKPQLMTLETAQAGGTTTTATVTPMVGAVAGTPAAPSNLVALAPSSTQVNLAWVDNSSNETGFRVYRSTDGVNYTKIATVGANVTSYSVTTAKAATKYYFQIKAYNSTGASAYSNLATVTTPAAATVPAAPSGLTASAYYTNLVDLKWTDNSTNETGFLIEQSTAGGAYTQIATVAAGTTTYQADATGGTAYSFRVRATNASGNSAYSNVASVTTPTVDYPKAPSALTAAASSSSQINLAWTDNSGIETGFEVYRSTDGVNFSLIGTTAANATTYSATGLAASTTYTFRVCATNTRGDSAYTNNASATTQAGSTVTVPAAPSALTATAASSSQINLAWTDNSTNETGFKVEQSTDGTNYTQVATVAAGAKSYSASGLSASTTYMFRVCATNSAGDSADSNVANATTQSGTTVTVPTAPSGLTASAASSSQINLTWVDNSNNETGFKVERSTDGTNFTQVATVGAGVTNYAATGLTASTAYTFRVRATNTAGDSAYTNTASATTQSSTTTGGIQVIKPGSGWTGATSQPASIGNSSINGYDAKSIAHWDTVPNQTFNGSITVGVVAFHYNGIDRVDFAVNGGAWVSVKDMVLNPTTNVWEYAVTLNAADFADGRVEVRAIAYPSTAGQPRVLESMYLNANANGSLTKAAVYVDASAGNDTSGTGTSSSPYKTIAGAVKALAARDGSATGGDNATIYLKAGSYGWSAGSGLSTSKGWLNIAAAPGVAQSAVTIVDSGSMQTSNIHLQGVTVKGDLNNGTGQGDIWLDNVAIVGSGLNDTHSYADNSAGTNGLYYTNSTMTNVVEGMIDATLVRNSTVDHAYDDFFSDSVCVINSEAKNQLGDSAYHSDIWQQRTDYIDNIILYGLKGTNNCNEQGIFSRCYGISNVAVVNCNIYEGGYPAQNQWMTQANHMVYEYNTMTGTAVDFWLHDASISTIHMAGSNNVTVDHNVFQWMDSDASTATLASQADMKIDSNHFINYFPSYYNNGAFISGQPTYGTNATTGLTIPSDRGAFGLSQPPMTL